MTLDPYRIREDFPILKRRINGNPLIYFDNAASSQKPKQVIGAISDYYEKHNANVHRGVHTLSQEASEIYENAHADVANFINAQGIEEVVFVRGTTEAINLVAYAWAGNNLKRGDEVVISTMEHHSNIVPWELMSKTHGIIVKYADMNPNGTLNWKSLEDRITNRTKIVSIVHVSNVTGVINDIKRVARLAHEYGAISVADGAQSVPHLPVDVEDLDVDFLAFSGHKMLAPTGIGVLYGKRELLDHMEPFQGGGEMIKEVELDLKTGSCKFSWRDLPWKFEAGTPNVSGGAGMTEAVKYLRRIGMGNVKAHEEALTSYALKRLSELRGKVTVYGPKDASVKCGIIPFGMRNMGSHDIALYLDSFGIMIRSGLHCAQPLHTLLKLNSSARASFYIYNTREEIDRFAEVLEEIE